MQGRHTRGKELAGAREAAPLPSRRDSLPSFRWSPAPARCSPSRRSRSQRRAALRALGERGGVAEAKSGIYTLTSASRIHILTPRPHPRSPLGRAFAADGPGRPRGRGAAPGGSGGGGGGSGGSRPAALHCLAPGRAGRRCGSGGRGLLAGAGDVAGLGQ